MNSGCGRCASLHDGDPGALVSEYDGIVTCLEDRTERQTKVGRVHALKVHSALAASQGTSLFAVCDSHSQELHVLHALLYKPDGYGFRDPIVERFDAVEWDLLVLDYVVLHPKWRGLKVGLLIVRKLVDLLGGGCGLAVAGIGPLNPDAHGLLRVPAGWIPRHRASESKEAAVQLRRYFRRMGFERLGRTPYYALPTARPTPTAEDLLGAGPSGEGDF